MIEVTGFRGLTFVTEKVGSQDHVITPPYDVISPEERAHLAASSPYNFVHLILPEEEGGRSRYEVAGARFSAWIAEGVLLQDPAPCFYLLRQRFQDLEGMPQTRRGFFAAVSLPETGERTILGHEYTFPKPVEDRLRLMQATRANLGAVFGLYPDPGGVLAPFLAEMERRPADATAYTIDGVRQEFWRVREEGWVTSFFRDKTLYIADGHHRFQTACRYRDLMRAAHPTAGRQPYDSVLMGLIAFEDPGLRIYPAHRVVPIPEGFCAERFLQALTRWFVVEPVLEDLPGRVKTATAPCVLGVAIPERGDYLLTLRDVDRVELLGSDRGPAWRDLDVAVLHGGILERILGLEEGVQLVYEKNVNRALAAAHRGGADLAFLLRATRGEQIRACAEAGEPMPQKSTYFFPKLPSGGVIKLLV